MNPQVIKLHDILTVSSLSKTLSDTLKIGDSVTIVHIYAGLINKVVGFELEFTNKDGNPQVITAGIKDISFSK